MLKRHVRPFKRTPTLHYNPHSHNHRSAHIDCYVFCFSRILPCKNIPEHIALPRISPVQCENHTNPCTNHRQVDTLHAFQHNSNNWNSFDLDTRDIWRNSVTWDDDTIPGYYRKSIPQHRVVERYSWDVQRSSLRIHRHNLDRRCIFRRCRCRSRLRHMVGRDKLKEGSFHLESSDVDLSRLTKLYELRWKVRELGIFEIISNPCWMMWACQ